MHYPVMTEKHLAGRWQVSLKTLRRWRLDGEGPVWHKLFRQVRYHEADILEFELALSVQPNLQPGNSVTSRTIIWTPVK